MISCQHKESRSRDHACATQRAGLQELRHVRYEAHYLLKTVDWYPWMSASRKSQIHLQKLPFDDRGRPSSAKWGAPVSHA